MSLRSQLCLGLVPKEGQARAWGCGPVLTPRPPPGFVQFLQYYYQSGCLYRLRALGERHTMDLTVGESDEAALPCRPCLWPGL